ncbi:Soluble calcium-activated nucleotidase 1 [Porphyridium purpureum]|uniref:Soluble calcium-activated nucleotidase 1 n=1 Tax=Porphyridium purpureum TaxID=35688 RepID=A0A5J4YYP3_PORPP|nr:Soluble calcium-activated nucleotidase 1 [Porphyridium purpureum]|eukprot:POR3266..scf209_3
MVLAASYGAHARSGGTPTKTTKGMAPPVHTLRQLQARFRAIPNKRRHAMVLTIALCVFSTALVLYISAHRGAGLSVSLHESSKSPTDGRRHLQLEFTWKGFGWAPRTHALSQERAAAYAFCVVTDQDKASRKKETPSKSLPKRWVAYFRRGVLEFRGSRFGLTTKNGSDALDERRTRGLHIRIRWIDPEPGVELWSRINEDGRGMELSELLFFDNRLLSPDDRTGVIYEIVSYSAGADELRRLTGTAPSRPAAAPFVAPRMVLPDGDGNTAKGFKGEWMVVKDGEMVVGGHGKEFTSPYNGTDIQNYNPMWVKVVDSSGGITHVDWKDIYNKLRHEVGADFPGYLIHEAVLWSALRREWVFLPRRFSTEPYREDLNERKGWNRALIVDEDFTEIRTVEIQLPEIPERGFSSAKFVPGSDDSLVLAIRTTENEGISEVSSYMSVVSILTGAVVMPETIVGDVKYEGLEFFPLEPS